MTGKTGKTSRSYRPSVEALEALRLLSGAAQSLPGLAVPHDVLAGAQAPFAPDLASPCLDTGSAWDAALADPQFADLFADAAAPTFTITPADSQSIASGYEQLSRYLGRTWYRAGIPVQLHDDSTQAVFVTLLQNLGRTRFDQLLGEIGLDGIPNVLSRETPEGPDFFRAIDTVKKRAQRERSYQPLDTVDVPTSSPDDTRIAWRGALQEAMDQSLSPREASLVHDTLMGKTPAEIAAEWGVAPKTVSNEKTRVLQKLRDALVLAD